LKVEYTYFINGVGEYSGTMPLEWFLRLFGHVHGSLTVENDKVDPNFAF